MGSAPWINRSAAQPQREARTPRGPGCACDPPAAAGAPNLLVAGKNMATSFFAGAAMRLHPVYWSIAPAQQIVLYGTFPDLLPVLQSLGVPRDNPRFRPEWLLDLKARLDSTDKVTQVVEALHQTNEVLDDAVWVEANELTGHTTSVRTGLPEPTWRKLYGGVQPSKTTSVKVREGLGMLENYAEIDKSLADLQGINGEIALKVVRRTKDSIIVRGAKILATLGPFADELFVYPGQPQPPGSDPAALLSFSIPMGSKGLHTLCRDHYGVGSSVGDRPFSSRFDEQDAFMIFDDVEIPNERVFIDGDGDVYNGLMQHGWAANIMQQTSIRAAVKLEFAYELCTRMAQATNSDKRPETAAMLGELWSYACLTRSAIHAAEAGARDWGNGAFFPDDRPFRAVRANMPGWMVRANEIIKTIGSHNLLATPSLELLDNPEIGPLIEAYMPGANGMSARERAKLFRTAWDFAGSALGSRAELYERFYLASAPRNYALDHMFAQMERPWAQFPEMLAEVGVK